MMGQNDLNVEVGDSRKRERHGTHHTIPYRPHAFRWNGHEIAGINFIPLSMSMRSWLLGRGQLPIASKSALETEGGYKNPYTFSGAALTSILAQIGRASCRDRG